MVGKTAIPKGWNNKGKSNKGGLIDWVLNVCGHGRLRFVWVTMTPRKQKVQKKVGKDGNPKRVA